MASFLDTGTTDHTAQVEEPFFSKPASDFAIKLKTSPDKYWKLYKSSLLTDLTIICQDQQFPVHRAVLATESPSLLKILTADDDVKTIHYDLDPHLMSLTLECIYNGGIDGIPEHLAEGLAELSRQLGFTEMEQQCRRLYLSRSRVTTDNCLSACQEALALNDDDILAKYQFVAMENFPSLQKGDKFTSLDLTTVKWYLCHPDLSPAHPEDRLTASLLWLNSDIPARLEDFPSLLKCLPLSKMNEPFLRVCREKDSILQGHPESQQVLLHAIEGKAKPNSPTSPMLETAEHKENPIDTSPRSVDVKINTRETKSKETDLRMCMTVVCTDKSRKNYKLRIFPPKFDLSLREINGPTEDSLTTLSTCCSYKQDLYFICSGNQAWQYKVLNNTWHKCGTLKHRRFHTGLVVVSGVLYVMGGNFVGDEMVREVECMDMSTKTFHESGCLQGNECNRVSCCVSGSDILVMGATKKPWFSQKVHLLQVYSTISKSVLQSIPLPKEFGGSSCGLVITEKVALLSNGSVLYSCPLQSLYRGLSDKFCLLYNYRSPQHGSMLCQGGNGQLLLVGYSFGGKESFVYQAVTSDVAANLGRGWQKLQCVFSKDKDLRFEKTMCEIQLPAHLLV